jgi:hypothetical protein
MPPRITWAPRVNMARLARLYQLDGVGLEDEELAAEVGSALFQRVRSILMVTDARQLDCPQCGALIECPGERWSKALPPHCAQCGFQATYGQWRDSWRKQELVGGNALPVYRAFLAVYPQAKTYPARLLLIDQLIHAFHYSLRQGRTFRPVGQQLIQGSAEQVLAFLDRLAGFTYATPALNASAAEWQQRLEQAAETLPFLAQRVARARQLPAQDHSEDG